MQFLKHNGLFLALLVIAVVVYSLFVLPWLRDTGHIGVAAVGYGVFALMLVYGRANRRRPARPNVPKQRAEDAQRLPRGRRSA